MKESEVHSWLVEWLLLVYGRKGRCTITKREFHDWSAFSMFFFFACAPSDPEMLERISIFHLSFVSAFCLSSEKHVHHTPLFIIFLHSDELKFWLIISGRGIYILYEDVKSCPYEDVHVLWSILVESHPPCLPSKKWRLCLCTAEYRRTHVMYIKVFNVQDPYSIFFLCFSFLLLSSFNFCSTNREWLSSLRFLCSIKLSLRAYLKTYLFSSLL